MWELEEYNFKKEKDCFNQNDSLSLSYCFLGPRWLPSDELWRGQDHGFWREVSLGRPGASSSPSWPPGIRRGGFDRLPEC